MSTKVSNEPLAFYQLALFDAILKACGGRYVENPRKAEDQFGYWRVSYEYDNASNYQEHCLRWHRATTDVAEVRKDAKWRILLRRIHLGFLERNL